MPIIYKQRGSLRHEPLSELHRQNYGVLQFKNGCGSCKCGGQADIGRCTSVPRTERRQGDDRYSAPPACIHIPDSAPSSHHCPTAYAAWPAFAVASGRNGSLKLRITFSNCARSSDCGPSESARSGQGCTSTMIPSAPTAIAARETAPIRLCLPVPCEGSAITGKCDSSLASAIEARSIVLRVAVSKVLMPRSHNTT